MFFGGQTLCNCCERDDGNKKLVVERRIARGWASFLERHIDVAVRRGDHGFRNWQGRKRGNICLA